jgi:hypothetical protein
MKKVYQVGVLIAGLALGGYMGSVKGEQIQLVPKESVYNGIGYKSYRACHLEGAKENLDIQDVPTSEVLYWFSGNWTNTFYA